MSNSQSMVVKIFAKKQVVSIQKWNMSVNKDKISHRYYYNLKNKTITLPFLWFLKFYIVVALTQKKNIVHQYLSMK